MAEQQTAAPSTTPHTPASDTGSPAPPQPPEASIDWVSATWPIETDLSVLESAAMADGYTWRDLEHGASGYGRMIVAGKATILSDPPMLAMGQHLQLKGEGCEQAAACDRHPGWQTYLSDLLDSGASFARLDVAFDDTSGLLDLDVIEQAMRERTFTSVWRTTQRHYERQNGSPREGRTYCWGKGAGKMSLRIYDYAVKHGEPQGTHHIRVELQCRDQAAQAVAELIAAEGFGAVAALIRTHLKFRAESDRTRMHRAPLATWWEQFCGLAEAPKLAIATARATIETVTAWVRRSVMPSLALVNRYLGAHWREWLAEGLQDGNTRIQPIRAALLPTYAITHGLTL